MGLTSIAPNVWAKACGKEFSEWYCRRAISSVGKDLQAGHDEGFKPIEIHRINGTVISHIN
jgi:hypothetical protein